MARRPPLTDTEAYGQARTGRSRLPYAVHSHGSDLWSGYPGTAWVGFKWSNVDELPMQKILYKPRSVRPQTVA